MLLVADVGGTNTTVALIDTSGSTEYRIVEKQRISSQEIGGLAEALTSATSAWKVSLGDVATQLVVSAAGPVRGNRADLTNVSWPIDGDSLSVELGMPTSVINDFTAVCYGIPVFLQTAPEKIEPLPGSPERRRLKTGDVIAVVGPGTGLGVGFLLKRRNSFLALPSEGGHMDFAPTDRITWELEQFLGRKDGYPLGWEPFVSGRGLANIFSFFCSREEETTGEARRIETLPAGERPAAIAKAAPEDPICARAVGLFVRLLGSFCSNIAVTSLPEGGFFLAGGVTIRNPEWFENPQGFLEAFQANYHPSLRERLSTTPVALVRDYDISLYGAAYYGRRHVSSKG
ncbi:MAG: glucokinase [Spirochaetaceae bacterium]